ncbi:hypothetical protein GCM10009802_67790 [Streptomyces synnematoformans]|uniref:Uncharacterized protein n=1 Tax=Streptomyces synnematoformans TaxID=415721 RepID=A0ABN2AEE1_9ACTN
MPGPGRGTAGIPHTATADAHRATTPPPGGDTAHGNGTPMGGPGRRKGPADAGRHGARTRRRR